MKKEKIYLKALFKNKLIDIDLDTIKNDIFKEIDNSSIDTYLFTIMFFKNNGVDTPLIRKMGLPSINNIDDEEQKFDSIVDILDTVNCLSDRPIYSINKTTTDDDWNRFKTNDDEVVYVLRNRKGEAIKYFKIKF